MTYRAPRSVFGHVGIEGVGPARSVTLQGITAAASTFGEAIGIEGCGGPVWIEDCRRRRPRARGRLPDAVPFGGAGRPRSRLDFRRVRAALPPLLVGPFLPAVSPIFVFDLGGSPPREPGTSSFPSARSARPRARRFSYRS